MEPSNSNIKKFLIFQETETPKKLLILSQEKAFLIFWKMETPKKTFLYFCYILGSNFPRSKSKKNPF